jgi:adsorption protein B
MPMEATLYALGFVERELLLFAAVWFVIGAADDLGMDMLWLWLRLSGRARTGRLEGPADQPLRHCGGAGPGLARAGRRGSR